MCTDLITSLDSHGDCGEPVGLWCEVSAARPTAHPGRAAWWIDATGLSEAARDAQECDRVLWAWVHPTPDTSAWAEVSTSRDTDPGEAGAGGDCGEHTDDTPAMPLAECAQVCWRAVMAARTSSVQSWCMPYGMGDGRTWNKRWRVARFRKWGRVNAPRWTSRHPHPLATV